MLAVGDMEKTLNFYREVLGFSVVMASDDYSIIERDRGSIHLMKAVDDDVMDHVRGHTQIYIEVGGIEELWTQVKDLRSKYKIRDLFDQVYGMREFHIEDPNGCLVFVGQTISE